MKVVDEVLRDIAFYIAIPFLLIGSAFAVYSVEGWDGLVEFIKEGP